MLYIVIAVILLILVYITIKITNNNTEYNIPPPDCLQDDKWGTHNYIVLNNNLKMHYVEKGEQGKPLMLFLHGFPEFWYSWRYQIVHYSQRYHCIAPDLRGYGDTDKPDGIEEYGMSKLVEDVHDLIVGLGESKCVLVAHDWGGLIGYAFCARYPHMVKAYFAVNTINLRSPTLKSWQQRFASWYVLFFQIPCVPEALFTRRHPKHFFKKSLGGTDEDIAAYAYNFRNRHRWTCGMNYYRALFRYPAKDILRAMKNISVPVCCIFGTDDKYILLSSVQGCRDVCEDYTEVLLEGVSHFSQTEAPQLVNQHMDAYLKERKL